MAVFGQKQRWVIAVGRDRFRRDSGQGGRGAALQVSLASSVDGPIAWASSSNERTLA